MSGYVVSVAGDDGHPLVTYAAPDCDNLEDAMAKVYSLVVDGESLHGVTVLDAPDAVPGARRGEAVALLALSAQLAVLVDNLDAHSRSREHAPTKADRQRFASEADGVRHARSLVDRAVGRIPLDSVRPA